MIYRITAQTKNDDKVDLFYHSIAEAKFHNPKLTNFRLVGL